MLFIAHFAGSADVPVRIEREARTESFPGASGAGGLRADEDVRAPSLLISQTLNRIQSRGFARRPHAKNQTHAYAYSNAGGDRPHWD